MKLVNTKNFILITIISFVFAFPLISYSLEEDTPKSRDIPKTKEEIEREKRKGYTELKVFEYDYNNRDESDPESKELTEYYTYDKNGNILTDVTKGSGRSYKYNDKGLLIEKTLYDAQYKPESKQVYKYDDKGLCTEEISYDMNGVLTSKTDYEYDDDGDIIKKTKFSYDDEGHEQSYTTEYKYYYIGYRRVYGQKKEDDAEGRHITIYKYNDESLCIEKIYFNDAEEDESAFSITKYEYDDKGLCIEEETDGYAYFGGYEAGTSYEYNDKDLCIRKASWIYEGGASTTAWSFEYKYNEKGLCIEKTYCNRFGNPISKTVYEYK